MHREMYPTGTKRKVDETNHISLSPDRHESAPYGSFIINMPWGGTLRRLGIFSSIVFRHVNMMVKEDTFEVIMMVLFGDDYDTSQGP